MPKIVTKMLARYLNQLGIVLNYRDDPRLKGSHVLNPHWVTNGTYKILNAPLLEGNQGDINFKGIDQVLAESDYPVHMCRFVFDLMKKFDREIGSSEGGVRRFRAVWRAQRSSYFSLEPISSHPIIVTIWK